MTKQASQNLASVFKMQTQLSGLIRGFWEPLKLCIKYVYVHMFE